MNVPDAPLTGELSGGAKFVLAALLAFFTIGVVRRVLDRIRWHRAGRRGFDAFLAAGAPLSHERLLAAFEDPEAFSHRGDRGRVFSLGSITLPNGRLVLVTPSAIGDGDERESFDVELPAGVPLPVEGFALGDDPSWGFAALRIHVADGEPHSLEPAFTSSWRDGRAERERRIPQMRVESDEDVLVGAPEALDELAQRIADDDDAYDEILLKAPKGFHKQKGAQPLARLAAGGEERHGIVVARTWLMEEHARTLLQRDADGNVLAVLVDFGALGEPRWNWAPAR